MLAETMHTLLVGRLADCYAQQKREFACAFKHSMK